MTQQRVQELEERTGQAARGMDQRGWRRGADVSKGWDIIIMNHGSLGGGASGEVTKKRQFLKKGPRHARILYVSTAHSYHETYLI